MKIYGEADPETYEKRHSFEFCGQLDICDRVPIGAVFRVRNACAIHQFFQERAFVIHTLSLPRMTVKELGNCTVTSLDLKQVPLEREQGRGYSQDFFGAALRLAVNWKLRSWQ